MRTRTLWLGLALLASAATAQVRDPAGPALAEEVGFSLAFSPDGETLVYHRHDQLYALPVAGGEARALAVGLPETAKPDWISFFVTPDGAGVFFPSVAREWAGYTCPDRDLWFRGFAEGQARKVGTCYSSSFWAEHFGTLAGEPGVVFQAQGEGEQVGLYWADPAAGVTRRLDRPTQPAARVEAFLRLEGGRVLFVQDAFEAGARRLLLAGTAGAAAPVDLSAGLPEALTVIPRFPGRSDEVGDKWPVQVDPAGRTAVFGVAPREDAFGQVELWAVDLDGQGLRRLAGASASGVQQFVLAPGGKWAAMRHFDPGMSIAVASLDGASDRFVHAPPKGWQWTNHPWIPAGGEHVFFWGDLETQDQETWLYAAPLREGAARKRPVVLPRTPDHLLSVRPTRDGQGFLLRASITRRKGYRLFHLPLDGAPGSMLSEDERFTFVHAYEELSDGRVLFRQSAHENLAASLWVWEPGAGPARRVTPDLGFQRGVVAYEVDPTLRHVAYVLREKKGPTSLHLAPLPPPLGRR